MNDLIEAGPASIRIYTYGGSATSTILRVY